MDSATAQQCAENPSDNVKQRHIDLRVQEMGMKEGNPASTPEDIASKDAEGNDGELDERQASKIRSMAARANHLVADSGYDVRH